MGTFSCNCGAPGSIRFFADGPRGRSQLAKGPCPKILLDVRVIGHGTSPVISSIEALRHWRWSEWCPEAMVWETQ